MTLSIATLHVTGYFEGGQCQSIWSRGEVRFDIGMISAGVQSVCANVCVQVHTPLITCTGTCHFITVLGVQGQGQGGQEP